LHLYDAKFPVVIRIPRGPIQQSTQLCPLLVILVEAENFNEFTLDVVHPEEGHLLRSELVEAVRDRKLIIPRKRAARVSDIVCHCLRRLEEIKAVRASQLHLDKIHEELEIILHVGGEFQGAFVIAYLAKEAFMKLVGITDLAEEQGEVIRHWVIGSVGAWDAVGDIPAVARHREGQNKIGVVLLLNLWTQERVPVHELEVT